jgi:amino acid permease
MMLLAWRPFLDPLDLHAWWFMLLIPMAFFISLAYKAVRITTPGDFWPSTFKMTVQIILFIIILGIASFMFVEMIVPRLTPMPE